MAPHASRLWRLSAIGLGWVALVPACNAIWGIEDYPLRRTDCDPNSPEDCGAYFTCVIARPLGGRNYCAPRCDPDEDWKDSGFECLSSSRTGSKKSVGALVRTCKPSAQDPGCPPGLECYRTDLLYADRGVCLAMPVCNTSEDCQDYPEHRACATEVLNDEYGDVVGTLLTGNLHCLQQCGSAEEEAGTGAPCPTGEKCLTDLYPVTRGIPEICVPSCANQACPVNFHCLADDGLYPAYCVPGIPGYRCTRDQDCMLGSCTRIDSELSLCTVDLDCVTNDLCAELDSLREPFFCVEGDEARPEAGICVPVGPFGGPPCKGNEDCPQELGPYICSYYLPLTPDVMRSKELGGECHRPCDDATPCPARGGVPYVCLRNGECYPGTFGVPCRNQGPGECMAKLSCECVEDCTPSITELSTLICTMACETDKDCEDYNLTAGYNPIARDSCRNGFCRIEREAPLE